MERENVLHGRHSVVKSPDGWVSSRLDLSHNHSLPLRLETELPRCFSHPLRFECMFFIVSEVRGLMSFAAIKG